MRVVAFEGPSGIGKSRLSLALLSLPAARLLRTVRLRAEAAARTQILGPFRELFRVLLDFADEETVADRKRRVEELLGSAGGGQGFGRHVALSLSLSCFELGTEAC